ncbi:sulfatase-like hydrolase/transferase [Flammeovirga kamogawensis]|uniref:Sulfatase-like hydrolase/transferase n=1 Tax=Flammeovirga kamogawensis TaxID=373891 RepID=A0ABX8H354_9BACT|nr:sulfatase-like hydrolase/transferase [Flammeovirga kamogawensis]MBB6460180.1 putative outer membrane repeat protein [Flammeovirga kamogawensis]QWG09992.1 sulfatase-like hydrolase/transferase [Flammeovirga kamogawensis]TRX65501.1 sulfatase-like hydrolase/transferase [Flammeovirga kamogawensis]
MKRITIILCIALLTSSLAIGQSTFYVSNEGNDANVGTIDQPFATITQAITTAAENDIIHLQGTLTENNISVTKSLTFIGDNASTSIVQAQEIKPSNTVEEAILNNRIFNITQKNLVVKFKLLTLRHGNIRGTYNDEQEKYNLAGGSAIYNNNVTSTVEIEYCNFIDNYSYGQGGALTAKGPLTIKSSAFINNVGFHFGGAIYSNGNSNDVTIENSLFIGNESASMNGSAFVMSVGNLNLNNNTIVDNYAVGNKKVEGIELKNSAAVDQFVTITNNIIYNPTKSYGDNDGGVDILVNSALNVTAHHNIISATDDENLIDDTNVAITSLDDLAFGALTVDETTGLIYLPIYDISIALDKGDPITATDYDAFNTDRKTDEIPDLGTFEFGQNVILPPSIKTGAHQNYAENSGYLKIDIIAIDAVTYTITGGDDKELFSVNSEGHLSFINQPSLDHINDKNTDGVYEVDVTVTGANSGEITQRFYLAITHAELNVVMIVLDDLNDYIGIMGGNMQTKTPNIDKLADSGILFTNAHSNAPLCDPSRASFLSGILPSTSNHFGTGASNFKNNETLINSKLLSQYFQENGYTTYKTGKITHSAAGENKFGYDYYLENTHDYGPVAFNGKSGVQHPDNTLEMGKEGGSLDGTFGPLSNIPNVPYVSDVQPGFNGWYSTTLKEKFEYTSDEERSKMPDEKSVEWIEQQIKQLDEKDSKNPFMMSVGLIRPHSPFTVPDKYFEQFPLEDIEIPASIWNDLDDTSNKDGRGQSIFNALENQYTDRQEGIRRYLQGYLASIAFADEMVGRVVNAVENSQYADNTVIVLFSDHGYNMGEKDYAWKNNLWEHATRVPLIIKSPIHKNTAGQKSHQPVSLVDVYPTLKDLCYLTGDNKKNEKGADLDGHSMKPFLANPSDGTWEGDEVALTSVGNWYFRYKDFHNYALKSKRFRYISNYEQDDELYDHNYDKNEWFNVIDEPAYAEVKEAMEKKLNDILYNNLESVDELSDFSNVIDSHNFGPSTVQWGNSITTDPSLIEREAEGYAHITYEVNDLHGFSVDFWNTLNGRDLEDNGKIVCLYSVDQVVWDTLVTKQFIGNYTWGNNLVTFSSSASLPKDMKYLKISLEGNGVGFDKGNLGKVRFYTNNNEVPYLGIDNISISVDESIFELEEGQLKPNGPLLPEVSDEFTTTDKFYSRTNNLNFTNDNGISYRGDKNRMFRNDNQAGSIIYEIEDLEHFKINVWENHSKIANTALDIELVDHGINVYVSADNNTYTKIETKQASLYTNDIVYESGEIDEWRHSHEFAIIPENAIPTDTKFVKIEIVDTNEENNSGWNFQVGGIHLYAKTSVSSAKLEQTISITTIEDKVVSDEAFTIDASTTSGLALIYAIEGPATIEGNKITLTGETGEVKVTVTQAGNAMYEAASKTVTFNVITVDDPTKMDQVITISSIGDQVGVQVINVSATTTSGLTLTYEVEGPATLNNETITLSGEAGEVTITVTQAGNDEYNPASASITFTVTETNDPLAIENEWERKYVLYPVPAEHTIYIKGVNSSTSVAIYNVLGQFEYSTISTGRVDVSSLPAGVYIMRINNEESIRFQKK